VPAGGTRSGSDLQTKYEKTIATSAPTPSIPMAITIATGFPITPAAINAMPPATKTHPASRCVCVQERLLESVQGVRTPKNQFGRSLPITFPMTKTTAPTASPMKRFMSMDTPRADRRMTA
jgi:hypothetical protein